MAERRGSISDAGKKLEIAKREFIKLREEHGSLQEDLEKAKRQHSVWTREAETIDVAARQAAEDAAAKSRAERDALEAARSELARETVKIEELEREREVLLSGIKGFDSERRRLETTRHELERMVQELTTERMTLEAEWDEAAPAQISLARSQRDVERDARFRQLFQLADTEVAVAEYACTYLRRRGTLFVGSTVLGFAPKNADELPQAARIVLNMHEVADVAKTRWLLRDSGIQVHMADGFTHEFFSVADVADAFENIHSVWTAVRDGDA